MMSKKVMVLQDGTVITDSNYFEVCKNTSEDYWCLTYDPKTKSMVEHSIGEFDFNKLLNFLNNPKRKKVSFFEEVENDQ